MTCQWLEDDKSINLTVLKISKKNNKVFLTYERGIPLVKTQNGHKMQKKSWKENNNPYD